MNRPRPAPRQCPVCGDQLLVTRLGCPGCSTELSGQFESCEFCSLTAEDRQMLKIFLASRGNMKELERHLGVSYPTARARFDGLLIKLGIDRPVAQTPALEMLESLARGEITVDDALTRLEAEPS
ncbi:MAG: DUF2089 domain-containing protein [Candidatus Dormibacteraeota bacterium]|nr:DUF2089 domain-containing protein [Candidatus Dormibacteraeota bacterium]